MFDAKPSHSSQEQIAREREQTSGYFIPPVPALNSHSTAMGRCRRIGKYNRQKRDTHCVGCRNAC